MTLREKKLTALFGLLAVLTLPTSALDWMRAYFEYQALDGFTRVWPRYESAESKLAQMPSDQSTRFPALRPGEEGGPAFQFSLYTVPHHSYVMKPAWMHCVGGTLEPVLYPGDRNNERLTVSYRDAGDRWVFEIAVKFPAEAARAEAVVMVGCGFGGHDVQPAGPNSPTVKLRAIDWEA
jgi:hypothetical protein